MAMTRSSMNRAGPIRALFSKFRICARSGC
jgi:hypothetical protein